MLLPRTEGIPCRHMASIPGLRLGIVGGRFDDRLAAFPSWPGWDHHREPDPHSSTRIGTGQLGDQARMSVRHSNVVSGLDSIEYWLLRYRNAKKNRFLHFLPRLAKGS